MTDIALSTTLAPSAMLGSDLPKTFNKFTNQTEQKCNALIFYYWKLSRKYAYKMRDNGLT